MIGEGNARKRAGPARTPTPLRLQVTVGLPARTDRIDSYLSLRLVDLEQNPPAADAAFPQVPVAFHPVAQRRRQRILAELLESFNHAPLEGAVKTAENTSG